MEIDIVGHDCQPWEYLILSTYKLSVVVQLMITLGEGLVEHGLEDSLCL